MLSGGHAEILAKPLTTRLIKFQPSVPGHVACRCLLPPAGTLRIEAGCQQPADSPCWQIPVLPASPTPTFGSASLVSGYR
jgi:hypothetical protein